MAQVKIDTVQEYAKLAVATLAGGVKVLYFKDAPFAGDVKEGATVEMKTEEKPNKDNPSKMDKWVVSVNGVEAKRQGGGGGGGGRGFAPKTLAEVHGMNICGVIKSCCEAGFDPETTQKYLDVYHSNVGRYA